MFSDVFFCLFVLKNPLKCTMCFEMEMRRDRLRCLKKFKIDYKNYLEASEEFVEICSCILNRLELIGIIKILGWTALLIV